MVLPSLAPTRELTRWQEGSEVEQLKQVALLIIDVQRELFEEPTPVHRANEVLKNIIALVGRAHAAGAPVFWVQHSTKTTLIEDTDAWQLHPVLRPLKMDHFIRKHHGNAFEDTPLKSGLDGLKVGTVVGLISDGCVQATCKGAHALGYDVTLVEDAHSTNSPDGEHVIEHWNETLSHGIVQLQSTAEVDFGGLARTNHQGMTRKRA
jgi:nicotinamidase-related amidase